jgi:hypothetical protein
MEILAMEERLRAIEDQIEKLRMEREKRSHQSHSTQRDIMLQKLVIELLDQVINDLELRKMDLYKNKGKKEDNC